MHVDLKNLGFVRKMDDMGRLSLPVELRKTFDIGPGTSVEILPGYDGTFTLRRYIPGGTCTFCGGTDHLRQFVGRPVCRPCIALLVARPDP